MKSWKNILIGVIVGSLISGGVLTWASISQEVGENIFLKHSASGGINSWQKLSGVRGDVDVTPFATLSTMNSMLTWSMVAGVETGGDSGLIRAIFPTTTFTNAGFVNPTLSTASFLYGFDNSSTWRQIKLATVGDNYTGNDLLAAQLFIFDGTNVDRVRGTGGSINVIGAGAITPSDNFSNPTTAQTTYSLNGEFNGTTWDQTRHSFTQTTAGVNANGAGTAINMTTTPMKYYTISVLRTAGATDAVTVFFECSLDGTNFISLAPAITTIAGGFNLVPSTTPASCLYGRYNVNTIGAGNTLTIRLLATR